MLLLIYLCKPQLRTSPHEPLNKTKYKKNNPKDTVFKNSIIIIYIYIYENSKNKNINIKIENFNNFYIKI